MPRSVPRVAPVLALCLAGLACPAAHKEVVVDLARRLPAAARSSEREAILFGTPASEPHETDGFYREPEDPRSDPFRWLRRDAEISLTFATAMARAAIVDLRPYQGLKAQSVRVSLNGHDVGDIALAETRRRYLLTLPAAAQQAGKNSLRLAFRAAASPADGDPKSGDHRPLAAAIYGIVVGAAEDAALLDLVRPDAPPAFSLVLAEGIPTVIQVGPSAIRYALRLPAAAELRFTPELFPAARPVGGSAHFRVTIEDAEHPGGEREIWSYTAEATAPAASPEVVLPLPGEAGAIVRLGLHVTAPAGRFAWGVWRGPRVLGRGRADLPDPVPWSPEDAGRGNALRAALAGSNVLLVILDAARAQELGSYGYNRATTPEIDRLAKEGVAFDRAFTPAVHTQGAMASLWTSQEPDRHHGAVTFSAPLPKDRLTLAELLSANGVHTAGFVANAVAGVAFGFDRGFNEFREVYRMFPAIGSRGGSFRRVLPAWLEQHRAERFFAYVHFREPHFPYDPEPPFDTRFGPAGPIPRRARSDSTWIFDVNHDRRVLTAEERDHLQRLYDGNLAFADQELGAIRHELERLGLLEKTVVIVAADHGEALHEHGWIGHNVQLYEESLRVPLVIRFPAGHGPAGGRIAPLVDLLDIAPTIADIFGVLGKGGSDRAFSGRTLLPVVGGAPGKAAVLSRTVWDRPIYSLRDERYKYLFNTQTGEEQLFDLTADPGEQHDRQGIDAVRTAYYRESLHEWIVRLTRAEPPAAESSPPSPEQCENMKALGYVVAECH